MVADPPDACCLEYDNTTCLGFGQPIPGTQLRNAADIAGKVAVVYRGACLFSEKAANAQNAGAVGVLAINVDNQPYTMATGPWHMDIVNVPTVMVGADTGAVLVGAIGNPDDVVVRMQSGRATDATKEILAAVYEALGGANWERRGGWEALEGGAGADIGDPCLDGWEGVYCTPFGEIFDIDLANNNLVGTLPEKLTDATQLSKISVSGNPLVSGTLDVASRLPALSTFGADGCKLTGTIPSALGALPNLSTLRLMANALTGAIPESLATSPTLSSLRLQGNQLSGEVPLGFFLNATSLEQLSLSNNPALTWPAGSPAVLNMTAAGVPMVVAHLDGCGMDAELPTFVSSTLEELWLGSSGWRGRVDDGRLKLDLNLPALVYLDLQFNAFTGFLPPLLDSWDGVSALGFLYANDNSFDGQVPDFWDVLYELKELSLQNNNISDAGFMPSLTGLRSVNLANNSIAGSAVQFIAVYYGAEDSLGSLSLADNQLSGPVSEDFAFFSHLNYLSLAGNNLTGGLPDTVPPLARTLDFSRNGFSGAVPQKWSGVLALAQNVDLSGNPALRSSEPDLAAENFLAQTGLFVKDARGDILCPTWELRTRTGSAALAIDQAYFGHQYCRCELGFFPDPAPPLCTEFLREYTFDAPQAIVSDGSMSGRIRDGLDVNYVIEAADSTRVIVLSFGSLGITADSEGAILNVHDGRTRRDAIVASPTSEDLSTRAGEPYYVFGYNALLHFLSEDSGGPYFNVSYEASDECPAGYAFDATWGRCQSTQPCPLGHRVVYSSEGERACTPCEVGHYQDVPTAAQECKACPANAITLEQGSTARGDCMCKDNYVGERGGECLECSADGIAFCPGRERGHLMAIEAGYFKATGSYEVYACPAADACQGTEGLDLQAASECSTGSGGPLCEVCVEDYYKISGTGCLKCGAKAGAIVVLALLCLMPIVAYALIFRISDPNKHVVNVKIAISFAQSVYIFSGISANWPSAFQDFMSIFGIVNLDLVELSSPQCALDATYSYFDSFGFYIAALPAEVAVVAVHYYLQAARLSAARDEGSPHAHAKRIAEWRARCWRAGLFMTTLTYPGVATKLVQYFNCKVVGGVNYLQADYTVVCNAGQHEELLPVALVFTALVVAGFPLALLYILVRKQLQVKSAPKAEGNTAKVAASGAAKDVEGGGANGDKSETKVPNRRASTMTVASTVAGQTVTVSTESRFMMLTEDYHDHAMYWEVTEMVRKLLLSLVPVLAAKDDREQLITAAIISLVWLQATNNVRPYKLRRDQMGQTIGLFVPVFTLLLGMFGRTNAARGDGSGRTALSGVLVAINSVAMLLISFIGIFGIDNDRVNALLGPLVSLLRLDTATDGMAVGA